MASVTNKSSDQCPHKSVLTFMQISVSIIMPVYNASSFLDRAIKSICCQDFQDWELIAIDDGSKDVSGNILDKWSLLDSRIHVLHQENQGVSATRQEGVNLAKGKYVIHVDADDWVETDYLSSLVTVAERDNADFVWCDCYTNEDGLWQMPNEESGNSLIKAMLQQKIWGMLWNKLIRTSICQREDVFFPKDCSMWEDLAFCIQCLLHSETVSYCDKALYHYNLGNTGSLVTRQQDKEISEEWQKAISRINDAIIESDKLNAFEYELNEIKLFAIRNYIDDIRFRNYDKFLNTYPEAIAHIEEYPNYPRRLKSCAQALIDNKRYMIPFILKYDSLLRKFKLRKTV